MKPVTILVIEDDKYDYESVFRKLNYFDSTGKIIHIDDGKEAVDYLFQTGPYANNSNLIKPDLILLDLGLPKITGLQILQIIKEKGTEEIKNIPVIIFTNDETNPDNATCFELGAKGYLNKPIQINQLKDLMIMLSLAT